MSSPFYAHDMSYVFSEAISVAVTANSTAIQFHFTQIARIVIVWSSLIKSPIFVFSSESFEDSPSNIFALTASWPEISYKTHEKSVQGEVWPLWIIMEFLRPWILPVDMPKAVGGMAHDIPIDCPATKRPDSRAPWATTIVSGFSHACGVIVVLLRIIAILEECSRAPH